MTQVKVHKLNSLQINHINVQIHECDSIHNKQLTENIRYLMHQPKLQQVK